LVFDKVS